MSLAMRPDPVKQRIPFSVTEISSEARKAVDRVLASGWVTTGPEVAAFEEEFAAVVDAPYAVAVASCTVAIELALRALQLPPGAKVLTSDMTFCGAVHAIVHAGLQPILADVNPETLMPDVETTADAARRAGGVDCMVVLHFAGHPAPVDQLAEAAGLTMDRVIEDAAHAIGASLGDQPVGSISRATCFSFYATKNVPIGEGGMVTTADPQIADYVKRARLHGMSRDAWKRYLPGSAWRYEVSVAGLKANMTDIQGAIGRAQLRRLEEWQARREEIAIRYQLGLSGIPGIRMPAWPAGGRHAWHLYVIRVGPEFGVDRDTLISRLAERGIDCSVHFIPIHHQAYFKSLLGSRGVEGLSNADHAFDQILSVPLYPLLSAEDVDRVCTDIADIRVAAQRRPRAISPNGNGHATHREMGQLSCLIVGAEEHGRGIAEDLRPFADFSLRPIGFLDDRVRRRVAGLPILGRTSELSEVILEHEVDLVIIADPSLPAREIQRLVQTATASGASVRYLSATSPSGAGLGGIRNLKSPSTGSNRLKGQRSLVEALPSEEMVRPS